MDIAALHARGYAASHGFGTCFEAKVARELGWRRRGAAPPDLPAKGRKAFGNRDRAFTPRY